MAITFTKPPKVNFRGAIQQFNSGTSEMSRRQGDVLGIVHDSLDKLGMAVGELQSSVTTVISSATVEDDLIQNDDNTYVTY